MILRRRPLRLVLPSYSRKPRRGQHEHQLYDDQVFLLEERRRLVEEVHKNRDQSFDVSGGLIQEGSLFLVYLIEEFRADDDKMQSCELARVSADAKTSGIVINRRENETTVDEITI